MIESDQMGAGGQRRRAVERARTSSGSVPTRALVREIWLVDDDPIFRKLLMRSLTVAARDVHAVAFSGLDEADAALVERAPVGLILDERLGEEDRGHVWVAGRHELLRRTHVALCTSYVVPETSEFLYECVDALLVKPVTSHALQHFIAEATSPRPRTFDGAVAAWCAVRGLSPAQTQVVELLATGIAPEDVASRLGERSRGVPDAGATSCCLILTTLADAFGRRLA